MTISAASKPDATVSTDPYVAKDPQQQRAPEPADTPSAKGDTGLHEQLRSFASAAPIDDGKAPTGAANTPAAPSVVQPPASPDEVGDTTRTATRKAEATQLLKLYEPQTSDARNIQNLAKLQMQKQRGMPSGAAQFEADQVAVGAAIADLSPRMTSPI